MLEKIKMRKKRYYFYVVSRDYGFAPNPFHGFCTLACCKSPIRNSAKNGDWIIGIGSKALKCRGDIIYAMKVTEIISFNKYFEDKRFACKKPIINGSLKTMHGDNIYYQPADKETIQSDSHHYHENSDIRAKNIKKDMRAKKVLISNHFFYFGDSKILSDQPLMSKLIKDIKDKTNKLSSGVQYNDMEEIGKRLEDTLNKQYTKCFIYGDPYNWGNSFYTKQFQKIY